MTSPPRCPRRRRPPRKRGVGLKDSEVVEEPDDVGEVDTAVACRQGSPNREIGKRVGRAGHSTSFLASPAGTATRVVASAQSPRARAVFIAAFSSGGSIVTMASYGPNVQWMLRVLTPAHLLLERNQLNGDHGLHHALSGQLSISGDLYQDIW